MERETDRSGHTRQTLTTGRQKYLGLTASEKHFQTEKEIGQEEFQLLGEAVSEMKC